MSSARVPLVPPALISFKIGAPLSFSLHVYPCNLHHPEHQVPWDSRTTCQMLGDASRSPRNIAFLMVGWLEKCAFHMCCFRLWRGQAPNTSDFIMAQKKKPQMAPITINRIKSLTTRNSVKPFLMEMLTARSGATKE